MTYAPRRAASSAGAALGAVQADVPPAGGGSLLTYLDSPSLSGGFQVLGF